MSNNGIPPRRTIEVLTPNVWRFRARISVFLIASLIVALQAQARQKNPVTGDYTLQDGGNVSILEVESGLAFLNFNTGRFGVLHKDSSRENAYFAGPGLSGTKPREIEIFFKNVGKNDQSLVYNDLVNRASVVARKQPDYREEELTIRHDSIAIRATLSLPNARGPFPAIVLVHGGGPGPRSALKIWSNMYNRMGFACLAYDKRGSGETVGPDWDTFQDLADDALACCRFLRSKDGIIHQTVGIAAFSQGGWVSELAAARDPDLSFLIMLSCPVESPAERAEQSVVMRLTTDGFPEKDIQDAKDFVSAVNMFGRGRMPWRDYHDRLEAARKSPWLAYVEYPRSQDAPTDDFYKKPYGRYYDPSEDLKNLRIPVLVIYGLNDTTVPPEVNAKRAVEYLRSSSPVSMVVLMPNGNHRLIESVTGSDKELNSLDTYVQDYFQLIDMWLGEIVHR